MLGHTLVRWSTWLFLLSTTVFAQSASTRQDFAAIAAKSPGGVIRLNTQTFDAITTPNRDWSVSIQLTALDKGFKCAPCKLFGPNYQAVAKAWQKTPKAQREQHFFATLDFSEGRDIFRKLGLNTAPFVYFYPATKGPLVDAHPSTAMWSYDFAMNGFDADMFAQILSPHTPAPIHYTHPLPWELIITVATFFAIGVASYVFFASQIVAVLTNRYVWGVISLAYIITMCSGYMFVKIRNSPYATGGRNGGVTYVASGYQNQYGAEIWILGGIYAVLGLSQVALIFFVPKLPSPGRQRAATYIWSAVLVLIFSVLIGVFKIKNGSYPFSLLL